jgi:tetratricopeptide (TPR) repeat protein
MNTSRLKTLAAIAVAALPGFVSAATLEERIAEVQQEWASINYRIPAAERATRFEALAVRAHEASASNPGRAEPLVWEGIVVSSLAGAKGGLGALGLAKQAKELYERALKIRPDALEGSALNSLGVLYYKVPGWPIGFGDKARAEDLLRQALAINPRGIDPNYFYGEFLLESGKPADAVTHLERALEAPARPGREVADAGRIDEARTLLKKAKGQGR